MGFPYAGPRVFWFSRLQVFFQALEASTTGWCLSLWSVDWTLRHPCEFPGMERELEKGRIASCWWFRNLVARTTWDGFLSRVDNGICKLPALLNWCRICSISSISTLHQKVVSFGFVGGVIGCILELVYHEDVKDGGAYYIYIYD